MLKLDGTNVACNYAMCTAGGHASCQVVADHYARLCAAAQALIDGCGSPETGDLIQRLQGVLGEQTGLEGA